MKITPSRLKSILAARLCIPLAAMLATPSANAAFTIIATDAVEEFDNYTKSGNAWSNIGEHNNFRDLTAFDLTAGTDLFLYGSNGTDSGMDSTYRLTAGFGASTLVQAGTYQLTAYSGVGNLSPGRQAFQTFDVSLMTTVTPAEWSGVGVTKTVITPYVDPNPQHTIDGLEIWVPTTVQYVIAEGSSLIGTEFTWQFNGTKADDAGGYAFSVDNAFVMFEAAIPEPSAALLAGLGTLFLLCRRRA